MGAPRPYFLSNVAGGINQGANITDIADNEQTDLKNWYPYTVRLKRRNGTERVSSVLASPNGRYFENITNAFAYRAATGSWKLFVGGKTSFGHMSGNALTKLSHAKGITFTANNYHWSFRQYKDVLYAARPGVSNLQRITTGYADDAGIAAPSSAAVLSEGITGNLEAGDYIGVVTFYNTQTGAESDPSANSNQLTLAASKKINWTSIPTSTNPQVDARRLYRTLVDGDGVYFFCGQINDNTTTTFTDNVIQAELGFQASFENGLPPSNPEINELWLERMWLSDGRDLFYSEIGLPESYDPLSVMSLNPDDGHHIRGMLNFGDRLLVGKTNSVYYITSVDGLSFRAQVLTNEHGVFSHHTMRAAEGFAFWFGGDNFYQTDGNSVRSIGDVKVRTLLDSIDPMDYPYLISAVDESKGWYITAIPTLGKMAVYMYRADAWTIFDMRQADATLGCPTFITDFVDEDDQQVIYCNIAGGDEDSIFQFDKGNTDDGRPIECELTSKYYGFDTEYNAKIIGDIMLQVTPVAEDIDISVLGDDGQLLDGPRTMNLFATRQWFRAPMATADVPANGLAIKLEYAGVKPVDILGFGFTITDLERRVPVSEWT